MSMSVVWKKIGNKSIIPAIAAETIKWLCEILVTTTAYLHTYSICPNFVVKMQVELLLLVTAVSFMQMKTHTHTHTHPGPMHLHDV